MASITDAISLAVVPAWHGITLPGTGTALPGALCRKFSWFSAGDGRIRYPGIVNPMAHLSRFEFLLNWGYNNNPLYTNYSIHLITIVFTNSMAHLSTAVCESNVRTPCRSSDVPHTKFHAVTPNRSVPSGKPAKNYGKSPFLMGKSTISMAMFNSFLYVYQRVNFGKAEKNMQVNNYNNKSSTYYRLFPH